jgi:hypothetical protein
VRPKAVPGADSQGNAARMQEEPDVRVTVLVVDIEDSHSITVQGFTFNGGFANVQQ